MKAESIIHIATYLFAGREKKYVYLFKEEKDSYVWFGKTDSWERLGISASTCQEALRLARRTWGKEEGFRFLGCGYLYTLPERDEHGQNALYCQMRSSYKSFNGIFFDPGYGHSCIVKNASQEALDLMLELDNASFGQGVIKSS